MLDGKHISERRFHINLAFWAGLEIIPQPTLVNSANPLVVHMASMPACSELRR
jgi:hypothetical protein